MNKDKKEIFKNDIEIKSKLVLELDETSQFLKNLENKPLNKLNKDDFTQSLERIENVIQNRYDYDFCLRFAIHGLEHELSFSKILNLLLSQPEKVKELGIYLGKKSVDFPKTLQILLKETEISSTLRIEIRNMLHNLLVGK